MGKPHLDLPFELNEIMKEEAEIEFQLRKKDEEDSAWRQRKHELSNSFGEEINFGNYFADEGLDYFPVSNSKYIFTELEEFMSEFPWLFMEDTHVHPPDDLQNTRGYKRAFVFAE